MREKWGFHDRLKAKATRRDRGTSNLRRKGTDYENKTI